MLIRWAHSGFEVAEPDRSGSRPLARLVPATPDGPLWIALWIAVAVAEVLALRPVLFDREAPIQGIDQTKRSRRQVSAAHLTQGWYQERTSTPGI